MQALILVFCLVSYSYAQSSICDRYSIFNDNADQTKFITDIVNGVVTQIVTQVPNDAVRYFNGVFPRFVPVSTNYTSPASSAALTNLVNGLVSFFGGSQGLNCASFSSPVFDLAKIHKNVYVNAAAQSYFIDVVQQVMASPAGRFVSAQDTAAVRSALAQTNPLIVASTICSNFASYPGSYSSESDFMLKTIQTFAGLVTQPQTWTLKYFNGVQPPGSTDFTAGGAALTNHLDRVHRYFGGPGFGSCLNKNYPDYPGSLDNAAIHANMGITGVAFDQWVKFHIQALKQTSGLSDAAVAEYKASLDSFRGEIATQPDSICDKYASALNLNTKALVDTIVGQTIVAVLSDSVTRPYFDGRQPVGSTDFTQDGARATALANGLTEFFGGALGCSDGTIQPYTGPTMAIVHAQLGVTDNVFETFNRLLLGVMKNAGVSDADLNTVGGVLESLRPDIVPGTTVAKAAVCPKYSSALGINNFQLVKTIVDETVLKVAANPITAPYFNGEQPPGSTNFLAPTNSALFASLGDHLIQFFGGALGCSDGTITPYSGRSMKLVHQSPQMYVSNSVFTAFNEELLGVMSAKGVTSDDINAVNDLLETLRPEIVAPYTNEDFAPNLLSAGAIAGIIIGSLIIAVVFAGICVGLALTEKNLPKLH